MSETFLYQKLATIREFGAIKSMPTYIPNNLSSRIELRDYQINAFENTITYFETKSMSKNKQTHLLYHMATGSGKTVIMAGLILYLYNEGYRNFLFFTNQNNIIEKTKENFLNPVSGKHLFADVINLFGDTIPIKEVDNFSMTDKNAINISFISIQKLHIGLGLPKENAITIEDFEDDKVVLISDEAHHINTLTKKNKEQKEIETSWEYSVMRIFEANKENVLLEFTATADLKDPNVNAKYLDKIIFDYPLAKFRESGYTKDFQNMQIDYERWERTLVALILSEYRKYLFAELNMNIKPVVLLKSRIIKESTEFYDLFFVKLENLTVGKIENISNSDNPYLEAALNYFKDLDIDNSYKTLIGSLKQSFSEDKSIIMNGSTDNTEEKQLLVNSLEDKDNPYRIIFTVDMLNEGWDVLNLFDIVRLYETRQGGRNTISPYTIKEAQLIGRGARYCPFDYSDESASNKRKFDKDADNQYRTLETLIYHSKQDSRYISELKKALIATGLLPENSIKLRYTIKDEFIENSLYKEGIFFSNSWIEKKRTTVESLDESIRHKIINYSSIAGVSNIYNLFDNDSIISKQTSYKSKLQLKEIEYNVLVSALENFEIFKFNILRSYYPNLNSIREFLISSNYMGDISLNITHYNKNLYQLEIYEGVKKVMVEVSNHIKGIKVQREGTREFTPIYIREAIHDKTIQISDIKENGQGTSQNEVIDTDLLLDLSKEDWC